MDTDNRSMNAMHPLIICMYLDHFEGEFATGCPGSSGSLTTSRASFFVEPKLYNEYLKEEAQVRHQTAMMGVVVPLQHTLEDDATVLETVET
uniref:Uncharacterized protein n=1 Tax=Magallana gigas TaxID=29159 RepID=A0A8W8HUJ4_MAGGI